MSHAIDILQKITDDIINSKPKSSDNHESVSIVSGLIQIDYPESCPYLADDKICMCAKKRAVFQKMIKCKYGGLLNDIEIKKCFLANVVGGLFTCKTCLFKFNSICLRGESIGNCKSYICGKERIYGRKTLFSFYLDKQLTDEVMDLFIENDFSTNIFHKVCQRYLEDSRT